MAIMVMKGEMCAGDALIGYGKDLRGIGSELCCCGDDRLWKRTGKKSGASEKNRFVQYGYGNGSIGYV